MTLETIWYAALLSLGISAIAAVGYTLMSTALGNLE